jgi:hypothetical protein
MFPFWMESAWLSLPQLLAMLAGASLVVVRITTGSR